MNALIIDMTHGGQLIASEFSKLDNFNVFALDIYNTLSEKEKLSFTENGIKLVEKSFLDEINHNNIYGNSKDDFLIVAPIHCNIEPKVHMTHHEAVKFLMKDKINVPIIEVTGVKGKTSVVGMLRGIFKDLNPLVLSSVGVEVIENGKSNLLKRDISITPASIIESWQLAKDYDVRICIFETSLGGTGLADVGILTNIAENYPIASGVKTASQAKAQIFKSKIVSCDFDSLDFYSNFYENLNSFGIHDDANVNASKIKFGLDETSFNVEINDLKTINGDILNISFDISTFAPAEHHLNNVLSAICAALALKIPIDQIKKGLKNFRGINGRTSIRLYKGSKIIEEINPGINVTAIKKAVRMVEDFESLQNSVLRSEIEDFESLQNSVLRSEIEDFESSTVIFGGKYGVTCEEIDENASSKFFDELNDKIKLILVDELGKSIANKIERKYEYMDDFNDAIEESVKCRSKMILLIYRSNFSDIDKR